MKPRVAGSRLPSEAGVAGWLDGRSAGRLPTLFSSRTLVFAATLVLGACSQTQMLYANADWLLRRWVDGWVDANSAQDEAWREPFARAVDAHRRDLLPDIVRLLRQLDEEIGRGLSFDRLDCLVGIADRLLRAHAVLAVELGTRVLGNLSPSQIAHLAEEMAERGEEYRDEYLDADPERRRRKRADRFVERIERWTGELTAAQVRVVERAVQAMPELAADWLAYREARQRQLLALLRAPVREAGARLDRVALKRLLSAWWVDRAGRPRGLVERTAQVRATSIALVVSLDAMLNPAQRAALREKVDALRADLEVAAGGQVPQQRARADTDVCAGGRARVR